MNFSVTLFYVTAKKVEKSLKNIVLVENCFMNVAELSK